VQRIDYDEFGVVASDTQPGFQPFGFAGGLYDSDTQFVRFDSRDYDPMVGRWTTKDYSGFRGGMNFYAYVSNDPINRIDPQGRFAGTLPWWVYVAAGVEAPVLAGPLGFIAIASSLTLESDSPTWEQTAAYNEQHADETNDGTADEAAGVCEGPEQKRFTPNQEALVDLAKQGRRTGVTPEEADQLLQWADEVGLQGKDHVGTEHWVGGDHIHVGPVDHIPVVQP
jgi:RHS repeat-associated protein